ncbi:MAG: ATP-binding protein [Candidatus Omnitrophota bacterium]
MAYQILLIDDDASFRQEFREYLNDVKVVEASSGQEAQNILSTPNDIDLVILDEMLSHERGTEILPRLRQIAPHLPVILLTGYSSKDIAVDALRAQAADYLEKPLNPKKYGIIRSYFTSVPRDTDGSFTNGFEGKIEWVKRYLCKNYDKRVRLKDVAEGVCWSTKYLSRIFKEHMGSSFSEYKLGIKIEKAKEWLQSDGRTIDQISLKLGYENTDSFVKIFKKFNGCTPSEYRKKNLQQPEASRIARARDSVEAEPQKSMKRIRKSQKTEIDSQRLQYLSDISRLASMVAHELRNPIGVISTALWNIRRKNKNPDLETNIQSIEKKVDESISIINNLLNYSRLRIPRFKPVKLDEILIDSVQSVSKKFRHRANQVQIHQDLKTLETAIVNGDPSQLRQVFKNILINAYQALEGVPDPRIEIWGEVKAEQARVFIRDNGPGIKKQNLKKVFDLFYSERSRGAGLGLSIAKQLVEMHNGTISIKSEMGQGTLVSIFLPVTA